MPTLKHPPHSPKTPTSATANASASSTTTKMLDRVLSSRRAALYSESDDDGNVSGTDESKNRRPSLYLMASNYMTRFSQFCCLFPAPTVCLLLCIVLSFLSFASLLLHSRSFVCISPFDRTSPFGLYGLDSEFGSLGVPWCRSKHGKTVQWTSKDLIKGLEEFVPIYETRSIKNNMYGMGFDHSFGLWFIARWLKPNLMIESGAFKGHSTWVLRQALPDTPIISISPRHPEKYLKKGPAYVDGNCTYFAGKDFVDFGSVDWKSVMKKHRINDLSRVLIFFDDHQNELKRYPGSVVIFMHMLFPKLLDVFFLVNGSEGRVKQALNAGFQHLVFEDNYDTGTGDHYSLRHICDQVYIRGGGHSCFTESDEARIRSKRKKFWEKAVDIDEICGPNEEWWGVRGWMRDNFNHSNKLISYEEHFQNSRFIESILDVYWELPPVAGPSLTHQTRYDPARVVTPIVEDGRYGLFQRIGLSRLEASVFNGYTQMLYLQISQQES